MLKELLANVVQARRNSDRSSYYDATTLEQLIGDKARYLQASGYLDYPALVHLETRAVCNAACNFCPYEKLERKGTVMPDALIR
jgi:hypothetical protein